MSIEDLYLYVVPMPLNKEGQGPEMDNTKIWDMNFEVWDDLCLAHATFKTREEAENYIRARST